MSFILVMAKLNFQDYSSLQSHYPSEIILICWFAAKNYQWQKQLCSIFMWECYAFSSGLSN